jgi:RNA-directed DNA polymerase
LVHEANSLGAKSQTFVNQMVTYFYVVASVEGRLWLAFFFEKMTLQKQLEDAIREECDKLILKFHAYHNARHLEFVRNEKRIAPAPPKVIFKPSRWSIDRKHDPFYVKRKVKSIAKAIAGKIARNKYEPFQPYVRRIPKISGGTREVAIYQIPDAAVSKIFYNRLLAKNRHRFSAFSYAYRNDRNVHFAIQDIWLDISNGARSFIAEFDFSDFFGSISHDYLRAQFDCNGFFVSDEERRVINAFLSQREVGIPQGTSISLFLANLVCWKLDQELERNGLKFARYADDTVVWSEDYSKICEAFTLINEFSSAAGIAINAKKSDGISLLTKAGMPAEFQNPKTHLEFLGYSISVDSVAIKDTSLKRIKKQVSYLLYRNLIQPLKGNSLHGLVIPANDRDAALLTAIMQIRKYMFGGLTNQQLRDYVSGRTKRIYFKGIMSFYPLVNDEKQLKELDGWLISVIYRSLRLRSKLLRDWGHDRSKIFPFSVPRHELLAQFKQRKINGHRLLEIPSFMLIYHALKMGLLNRGIEQVMNPASTSYDY